MKIREAKEEEEEEGAAEERKTGKQGSGMT